VVTVDTLRPDALGWVSGANATPAIDRLAREGFAFPAAVAPAPLTFPSHAALMTGLLPRRLGLRDNGQVLGPGTPTLAERLKQRGYATAAFVSGYPLDSAFGLDRGFDHYDDTLAAAAGGDLERPAGPTISAALRWLQGAQAPWHLWVHLYDPHYPYEPPAGHLRPGPRGAYDGEVAYADAAVGELFEGVAARGGRTLTVFAGDHGESLGEHGEGTHGFFIYDSTVLVPLVVHLPGTVAPGSSRAPARLLDVVPTVLDLLGTPAVPGLDGVSLGPVLSGKGTAAEPAYVETWQPWLSYGWSPLRAVRHRGYKLIEAPRAELYALESDPGETRNRIAEEPAKAAELLAVLRAAQSLPSAAAESVSDPDAVARLRALGYAGTGAVAGEPPATGLRDPKDGAALRDLLTRGDQLLREGRFKEAVPPFEAVLHQDPGNRFALLRSGTALLRAGDARAAVVRLRRAVELEPGSPDARWAFAEALGRAGRPADAVGQWMEATRLQPRRAEAWANLGSALGLAGKVQEAVPALGRALELDPGNPRLLARLAFAEHGAGKLEDAARHLTEMAGRMGPSFPHSGALGLMLVELRRPGDAYPWLVRCRASEPEFAESRFALARIELARGRRDAASVALGEALRADPRLRARAVASPELAPLLASVTTRG
jgi:arylsulfatase A-like enzyme/Tfp pilus assembly protein PilF